MSWSLTVARGVALFGVGHQQFLAGALGHHDQGVRPLENALFKGGEKAVLNHRGAAAFRGSG